MGLMGTLAKVAIGYAAARGVDRLSDGDGLASLLGGGAQRPANDPLASAQAQITGTPNPLQQMMSGLTGGAGGNNPLSALMGGGGANPLAALMGAGVAAPEGSLDPSRRFSPSAGIGSVTYCPQRRGSTPGARHSPSPTLSQIGFVSA